MKTMTKMNYEDWLNLQTRLLWCYEGKVSSERTRMTTFCNNCAWLVRSGLVELRHDDKIFYAEPGQWMVTKPSQRVQSFAKDTQILSVGFTAKWPDGKHLLDQGLSVVLDAADYPDLEAYAKPMVGLTEGFYKRNWDLRAHDVDYRTYFELDSHLSKWLTILVSSLMEKGLEPLGRYDGDERVRRAMRVLNYLPIGEPVNQQQLADSVGLSLVHLTRLFHSYTNVTPKVYFENRRLEFAKQSLSLPDTRIKNVYYMLGFSKASNFSAWFKKHTGMSPRQFSQVK